MSNAFNNATKLANTVSVTDFGAKGDGTTDDTAALVAAIAEAAGGKLQIPAGTYYLPFTGASCFTPPADIVIEGDGSDLVTLVFVPSSSTQRTLFNVTSSGFTLKGVRVEVTAYSGQDVLFFNPKADNFLLESCELDGCVTYSGGFSHASYGVYCHTTGTQTGIEARNCKFTRFRYGFLKTNASTSTQRRIRFNGCEFYGNFNEDLSFNSPDGSSVMEDVSVDNCVFRDGAGLTASVYQLMCAFASVTNFRVTGCSFRGDAGEAVHIEENCLGGVVDSNTIEIDPNGASGSAAIQVTDNNISGSSYMPQRITIANNAIRKYGTQKEALTYGIWLVNDASAEVAAQSIIISGNVVYGFENGISVAGLTVNDGGLVKNNITDNCTNGFKLGVGYCGVEGNTSRNCTVGVYSSQGSAVADHTFIDCTTNVDAVTRPVLLLNPSYTFTEFSNTGGGSTYKALSGLGASDRLYGLMHIYCMCETSADTVSRSDEVTWDGTTFTRTNKVDISPGGMDCDSVRNSSNLAAQVFTSSTRSTVSLQVKIAGAVTVAV